MKKNIVTRVLAGILVVLMTLQLTPGTSSYARPAESSQGDDSLEMNYGLMTADAGEDYFVPLINGDSAALTESLEVSYLEPLEFSLKDFTSEDGDPDSIVYFYCSAEDPDKNWSEISDGPCTLDPGQYILTYSYNDPSETEVQGPDDLFGFEVTKATVSAPSNLHWDGSAPAWTAPTTTTDGGTLPQDVISSNNYVIHIYKNGVEVGSEAAFYYGYPNFANLITNEYKQGVYTYKAEVTVVDAHKKYFEDSNISELSSSFTTPIVKLIAGNGIESVSPAEHLLVPGNTDGLDITATVKSDYSFVNWTGTGARFADSTSAQTKVYIDAGYTGGTTLEITANAGDTAGPVISEFQMAGPGKLSAKASDQQDGVAAYAFSTETSASSVTWTEVSPAEKEKTYEYTLTSGGTYYFYAKDAAGNISKSDTSIQTTEIKYHDYYTAAGPKAYSDFIIGTASVTPATPVRPAYTFGGWYTDAELITEAAESYSTHSATPYELYAKWTPVALPEITVEGVTRTYTGNETKLSPVMSQVDGFLSYSWVKNGIEAATTEKLSVKNVSDSGTYSLTVTLKDAQGNTVDTETVNNIIVSISKADLIITADNKTITYNAEAPEYTLTYDTLLGTDTKDVVTGTVTCSYKKGDSVGKYDILLTDFSADNYDITTHNGTLTVNADSSTVTAAFKNGTPSYTYEKDKAFEPEVEVTMSGQVLDPASYSVAYTDNNKAGTATVTITSEYFDTQTLTFNIAKADFKPTVSMDGWKYGETKISPALSEDHPEDGTVTWYYALKGSTDFTTGSPENAGTYNVYAVIEETADYKSFETAKAEFTISRREITITANSNTFVYDGLAHSDNGYEVTGDGFVAGQNFYSVTVSGSVTQVTPDDQEPNNNVTYVLTSNTLPGNYDIKTVPGTLKVTKDTLPAPYNPHWNTSKPGEAVWVPVSKRDLTVSYEVELLAYDGSEYRLVSKDSTTDSSMDLSGKIRTDARTHQSDSYFFTVKAVPTGGTNVGNYSEGPKTSETGEIFTALLTATGNNVASYKFAGSQNDYVLLSGETVGLTAAADTGYKFSETAVTVSVSEVEVNSLTNNQSDITSALKAALTESQGNVIITLHTEDKAPEIEKADFTNASPYSQVQISFKGTDELGLTGWVIKKDNTTPEEADWTAIAEVDGKAPTEYKALFNAAEPGQYYAFFRDTAGNVSVSKDCFTIYKYNFAPGADDVTGTMNPVLKEESATITLPKETYERDGHSFKDWKSTAGIFEDGAKISANPASGFEDTLTALWAENQYAYTVKYYLMGLDGEYPSDPGQTKTFYAGYDAQISSDSEALKLDLTGFTRDDSEGKKSSITITEDGKTLNVYYSRNLYDLTLSYTKPGDSEATVSTTAYYFGADLTTVLGDAAKPAAEGYVFVGWFFGDTGDKPSTMPAANVTATGYFSNNIVNYNIRYYLQDLKADGTAAATYTLYTDGNKTIIAAFDEAISMDSTAAELPEGFSYNGAAITDAPYTDTKVSLPADVSASVSGTAAEGRTINVFADRNTYTATLNVWEGKVNDGTPVYTWSQSVLYGAAFPADIAEKNKDQWPHSDDYRLADYIGWSTDTQPTTMPAGDVTVTRQFVLKVTGSFKVSVYLETVTDDVYESPRSFTFYDNVGKTVTVGNDETDTVKISDFASGIPYFQYYDYAVVEGEGGTLVSGTVTDTNAGEDPLVLRIYMTRKVMTSTISYYADTVKIAEVKKSAKWGHEYHYDALSIFDSNAGGVWTAGDNTSGFTMTATVGGENPDVYNFRTNNYVAVYSGHYYTNNADHWATKDYNTVASLSENPGVIMGQSGNYATVRYSHVSPDDMYELKLGYNASSLSHGVNAWVPLTYKDEAAGLDFTDIRAANEAYFFENVTYAEDPDYTDYPGLGMYNLNNGQTSETTGRYIYNTSGTLKEGFSRVTINNKTYYQKDGVLYIPVTANNLFVGKWTSYSLPTNEVGYQDVTDFLAAYKAQWSEDPYAQGAYVYSRNWGSSIKYETSPATLTVTFRNGSVYQISYNLGGTVCSDESHRYPAGKSIDSIGCDHTIMHTRAGYDIVWYTDSAFTTKPTLPLTVDTDKMFFGRYEKKIVKSTAYAYYETADHPEIGGKTYVYITEDDLEALGEAVTVTTGTEKKNITDDTGVSREVELTTKTYTYDGKVVMESKEIPSLTFTDLTAAPSGLFSPEDGLRYDEANSANVVKGYVQDEGISFAAYYVRSKVTLSVDTKIDNVNVETTERRAGENITVATPTRGGYTFAGWTWEIYDSTQDKYVTWTAAPSYTAGATEITFRMPAENLKMTANWTTTDVSQTIYHFFQNHSGSYDKEATTLMLSETGTAATLSIGGSTADCLVYSNGGLSYESNGIRLYYVNATAETTDAGTVYTIKQEDLAGSSQSLNALQEKALPIEDNILTVPQYSFSYALYQYENDITRLESDDNYTNRYGMVLEYYYDLDKYEVETESIVFGGNGTLSIIGSGEYYYGKEATLRAAMSAGYTFEGWYKTSDLTNVVTYEDLPKDKCISTDATISVRVTDDTSYTAVMKAMTVDEPTITITGDNSYRYNSSAAHVITAVADFGESADPTCYVSGYQWYMNGVAISGATAVNYKIPSDLVAGDYKFTCVVTAKRKDNGITKEVTSNEFTVKVEKDLLSAYTTAADHTAMYDTKSDHTITLDVAAPEADIYKIYYSTEKALTAANCDTDGSETKPSFKDVKVTGGETDSYTVYYYIKSLNANYESCAGSNKVTIIPAPLTLTAGTGTYSKTYDGSAQVAGSAGPDGVGTDLYKLAHSTSVYVIHGLIGGDMTAGYIIDCKAEFNSAHTSDATAVTLSDIVLADNNGDILNNYAFEKTYTVILSGYIERRSLTLTWTNTVFDFDGSEHIPTAAISGTVPACDSDNLKVTVSGEQTYAGGWTALAHLSSEAAETHIDDYSVSNQSQAFTINKKSISVAMTSEEVTYDGGEHTLSDSSVTSGALVSGHSYTLSADKSYIHSGTYNITPVNVAVTDADGADMTGNYDITCQNTGVLTINPKTVTVSGITAEDKTYDGTTAAELTLSGISFSGLVDGDTLSLDKDKVTGTFDTKDAGEGKTVTISYLTGALSGSSAGDYSLDTANSQQTTTASIDKKEVTVKADSKTAVYGETPAFSAGYDGFIAGEDSSVITGSVAYLVGNSQATAAAYTGKEHVGTYTIYPDVTALSADNYTFKSDHDTLTITERPLTVSAKAGALISKAYDGTTAVKTALVRDT
ncbi:MAG: InlB B-repeat-containing protein, partial [Parasporobacterium sp.]|nr:InlB B-repeat-containing protein [Parasporobacterium sp.]